MSTALYRKYRPNKFNEICGQDHIIKILDAAISKEEVVHAYLFSGSRGIGKTSIARIFAKNLGCDPIDIYEIDAASNTSVEDIRALNENIQTQPVKSKYKVYILDEAHMLSKSAFNAFLKTLEEPPSHIIFILATTEAHKLPETIQSRCQSFVFKKPNLTSLVKVLKEVVKQEGYKMEESSISLIAMLGDGSFRDALGVLQKVLLASKEKNISHTLVEDLLGVSTPEAINKYLEALIDENVEQGIEVLEKEAANRDMKLFAELCIQKLRAVLVYGETKNEKYLEDFLEDDREFMKTLSQNPNLNLDILLKLLDAYKKINISNIPQLSLEIILLKDEPNSTD